MFRQTILLGIWSLAFVLGLYLVNGPNIVFNTLQEGGLRFWSGTSPYLPPGPSADVFHYSPFFAAAFGSFGLLPSRLAVVLWGSLNLFVFWLGVSHWWILSRRQSFWVWIAFGLMAIELDISLRYQQSNALLAGLTLIALAKPASRPSQSGLLLALAANLKVIPGFFALPLLYRRRRFGVVFAGTSLAFILLPCLAVGLRKGIGFSVEQWATVGTDLLQRDLNDIHSSLVRMGFPALATISYATVAAVGASLFAWEGIRSSSPQTPPTLAWYSLGMATALLLIPRVESPTFVWLAPAYLLLLTSSRLWIRYSGLVAGFWTTFVYCAGWPWKFALQQRFDSKTLGTLLVWVTLVVGWRNLREGTHRTHR